MVSEGGEDRPHLAITMPKKCRFLGVAKQRKYITGIKCPTVTYGFNSKASITTSSIGDTVSEDNVICYLQRTISANNGLMIESFKEYDYSPYNCFKHAVEYQPGRFRVGHIDKLIPLTYSITAIKQQLH